MWETPGVFWGTHGLLWGTHGVLWGTNDQIIRRPGPGLLSLLLGLAIGVMATLSMIEMWLHNAYEHGPLSITGAVAVGAGLYCLLQPYFPDFETDEADKRDQVETPTYETRSTITPLTLSQALLVSV